MRSSGHWARRAALSSGGQWRRVELAGSTQDRIGNRWDGLTQCQQQRLCLRHVERLAIAGKQLALERARFLRPDGLAKRIRYRALQPIVVLNREEVRVVRS